MPRKIKIEGLKGALSKNETFKDFVQEVAQRDLVERKGRLKNLIEVHPVSRELRGGVSSPNISGTMGGYGNLYTFLGGFEGDVVERIINNIMEKVVIGRVREVKNASASLLSFRAEVSVSVAEVDEPLSFENRGVIDAVENGIGNFSHFVYQKGRDLKNSRTGPAIQSSKQQRNQQFTPTEWISSLLKRI